MPARPTLHVILNEGSGATGKKADSERLADLFARSGANARILRAEGGDAMARLARQALAEKGDTIVAGGGDGTVSTVASLLVGSDRPLGVLPMGTFNYFARGLGIPLDLEAAARTVIEGNIVRIDVGEVNGRFFLNNSSLGLYPDILKEREQVYARFGRSRLAAYASVAFTIARPGRFLTMRLVADGREIFRRTPLLFVANNAYQVEAFRLRGAPCLENGAFALYITHPLGPTRMFLLATRTLLGRLRTAEDLDVLCTREVSIETRRRRLRVATDGELTVMESPLHYRVRSGALAVIAPARAEIEKGRAPIRQFAP
jgi:diacylglycerol kinase family enzyme